MTRYACWLNNTTQHHVLYKYKHDFTMLFRYLPLLDMVNNAYNNRAAIPKRICNKTADLLPDNTKDQSLIF